MASRFVVSRLAAATPRALAGQATTQVSKGLRPCVCTFYRPYSSADAPPPPLLSKLKGDLKAAMRAKDAARLAVLRSIISSTLNASKTASPIKTDAQLVALLRKTARSQKDTADEFRKEGRADLAEGEEAQISILEEYANTSGVESLGSEEIKAAAEAVLAELTAEGKASKSVSGELMKRLLGPEGRLAGKDVDKAEVVRIVKAVTTQA